MLLSRDPGLASITGRLLSNGDRIAHFRSAAELSNWSTPTVAAVVLDSQPQARRLSYKQVRDRYDGPLVMLLDKGERRPDLPPDGARHFLHRPFKAAELSKLLGTPEGRAGAVRGRDHRRLVAPRHRRAGGAGPARSLLPDQLAPVPAAAGPGLGRHGRRRRRPAGGVRGQRPGPVRARLHQLRRRRRRRGRERHPADLRRGRRVGRRPQHPAARVVGRLLPAPNPHRRLPGRDRGRRADPVHQPHQHRRHPTRRPAPRPSPGSPLPPAPPHPRPPTPRRAPTRPRPPGPRPRPRPPPPHPRRRPRPPRRPPPRLRRRSPRPRPRPPRSHPPPRPPTTEPPTTAPPTTEPPTTAAPTTAATTAAPTTAAGPRRRRPLAPRRPAAGPLATSRYGPACSVVERIILF